MAGVVLEVAVSDPRDVAGAVEGGADRLHLAVPGATCSLSPEPALVSAICHESDLPVFVLLRLNDTWSTTGGEFARLIGLAEDCLGCGATGVAFGFLDADLEIDTETVTHAARPAPVVPWTFTPRGRLLPRPATLVAPVAATAEAGGRAARPGRRAGMSAGYERPAGHDQPRRRRAGHARRWARRRARALAAPGRRRHSTSAPRSAPAGLPGPTSTRPTSGRGARWSTPLPATGPDDPDRPAARAVAGPDVVPSPATRRTTSSRVRPQARHPGTRLRPRPLRRTGGVLRRDRGRRRAAGQLARPGAERWSRPGCAGGSTHLARRTDART